MFYVVSTEESIPFPFLSKTLDINQEILFRELQDFADNFFELTYFTVGIKLNDERETNMDTEHEETDSDEDFNLHSSAYSNLYRVYVAVYSSDM